MWEHAVLWVFFQMRLWRKGIPNNEGRREIGQQPLPGSWQQQAFQEERKVDERIQSLQHIPIYIV